MSRTSERKSAFTLIELLVVISIITILMSILLPAIQKTRVSVGVGLCAKNMQTLGQSFHNYINEYMEKLPFVAGSANLDLCETIDFYRSRPSGFGAMYEADVIQDPEVLYCPSAEVVFGNADTYEDSKNRFEAIFSQYPSGAHLMSDYAIGYRTDLQASTGYSPYPFYMTSGHQNLEDLKKTYVSWMADCRITNAWWRPWKTSKHQDWAFCNIGMIAGGADGIHDYEKNKPTSLEIREAGMPVDWDGPCRDDYWPANDHPTWLWWRWYGPGNRP